MNMEFKLKLLKIPFMELPCSYSEGDIKEDDSFRVIIDIFESRGDCGSQLEEAMKAVNL